MKEEKIVAVSRRSSGWAAGSFISAAEDGGWAHRSWSSMGVVQVVGYRGGLLEVLQSAMTGCSSWFETTGVRSSAGRCCCRCSLMHACEREMLVPPSDFRAGELVAVGGSLQRPLGLVRGLLE